MTAPETAHYMIPASVPSALVVALAVAAAAAWFVSHRLSRRVRTRPGRAVAFAARVAVGALALLAAGQAVERVLVLATNWPLWPIALLGAGSVEIVLGLYALERRTVSGRAGFALAAMRVAIVALVVFMLAQPVRPWNLDKTIQRYVAVLVDTSASMFVPDSQLAPSERLRLAEALGAGIRRPYALDAVAEGLDKVRTDLSAQGEWLASLGSTDADARRKQIDARRADLLKAFAAADKRVDELAADVAGPLQGQLKIEAKTVVELGDLRKRLSTQVRDRLKEAAALTAKDAAANLAADPGRLLQAIRQAAADLTETAAKATALGAAVDEAAYAALPPAQRAAVDSAAARKRMALARDVLMRRPSQDGLAAAPGVTPPATTATPTGAAPAAPTATATPTGAAPATPAATATTTGAAPAAAPADATARGESLLDKLQSRYSVRLYTFAGAPTEIDPATYAAAYQPGENLPGEAATLPADQQETNLADALEKVMTEMSGQRLSGVLVLTDGRHNAAKSIDPLVRRMAVLQVPVTSVLFGGEKPPIDAGIISVEAPETLALRDKMSVSVEVKLDGLAGKEVKVSVVDGDKVLDSQVVRVPTDAYRGRVTLSYEPAAVGLHHYIIDVQKFDGEVMTSNNQYPLTVSVTDERTKLLVIDGRPRWEFRYIKNLFASRDRTVRLQYVLLEPDKIDGVPQPPTKEASVSRPIEEVEATALPKNEEEWMKFDVILLGDVSPTQLREEQRHILRKFVAERGGTLLVISGPNHMPHAFAETQMADLLPVTFQKVDGPVLAPPEKNYRIALTADGRDSVLMRQKPTPEENAEVWGSLPDIYWRHPILGTKQGATVLAYALPSPAPEFMPKPGLAGAAAAAPVSDDVARQRREFERENALIAHHNVALGKVMFLAFDHTWRLRYRVGDTYHHRFWGQVLRWATSDKLPAGTETVKIGTDRTRYAPHAPIRVRAKLAKKDFTPITSDDVAVNVLAGDQVVLHKKLQFQENSAGMYAADLGELPAGTYRVELDAPAVKPTLAEQGADKVAMEFSVEPSMPAEQTELSPDRGLVGRLANLTGGVVVDPAHAARVLGSLGLPTETEVERHEYLIWDSWPLLALVVLLATAEWLLRKKVGLA